MGWFRTTFSLNIPGGYDVPLSFEFDNESAPYRALLFVNGCVKLASVVACTHPIDLFQMVDGTAYSEPGVSRVY